MQLLQLFKSFSFLKKSTELLKNTKNNFSIKFLFGAAKSLYVAGLMNNSYLNRVVLLVPNTETLHNYIDDFEICFNSTNTSKQHFFSLRSPSKHNHIRLEQDTYLAEVIDTITRFSSSDNAILVAPPEVFNIIIPNLANVSQYLISLNKKQQLDLFEFTTQLSLNGFQREQYVSRAGEFAVRGGIVDIFAPNMQNPIRVEL